MSLASPYLEHYYLADGVTTTFSFGTDFTAISANFVKCIIYFQDNTSCIPTYTVNMGNGSITIVTLTKPDGTVLTVPPEGSIVRVFRNTPQSQDITASQIQAFTAKQLEKSFDQIVAMIQEVGYSDLHKTVRLTETQRDVSLQELEPEQDGSLLYWVYEEGQLKATNYRQDQVLLSNTIDWIEKDPVSGEITVDGNRIGSGIIHNDLTGRGVANAHPISAISGLSDKLNELDDKDTELHQEIELEKYNRQQADLVIENKVNTAISTADEAKTIATQAKNTASEALSTANSASTTATNAYNKAESVEGDLQEHIEDTDNPHEVTKAQVGLGNADNTADLDKPISIATQDALDEKQDTLTPGSGIIINEKNNVITVDVVDSTTSTATDKPLSANAGKELQDQIDNLQGRGRFLSVWDATTGLPTTEPETELPYEYHTGDFYIVGTVGTTNYKPEGTEYTGDASTIVETNEVKQNDTYFYDGSDWTLVSTPEKEVAFSTLAGSPYDNVNLAGALNDKANSEDNLTITQNDSDKIQAVGLVDKNPNSTTPVYDWVGTLAEYQAQNIAAIHPDWLCFITDDHESMSVYTKAETDAAIIANVINNVTSTATNKSLSAYMGRYLQEQITDIKNRYPNIASFEFKGIGGDRQKAEYELQTENKGEFGELVFSVDMNSEDIAKIADDYYVTLSRLKRPTSRSQVTNIKKMYRVQNDRRKKFFTRLYCWEWADGDDPDTLNETQKYYFYTEYDYDSVEDMLDDDPEIYLGYHTWDYSNWATCFDVMYYTGASVSDYTDMDPSSYRRCKKYDVDECCSLFFGATKLQCRKISFLNNIYFAWCENWDLAGKPIYGIKVAQYDGDLTKRTILGTVGTSYAYISDRKDLNAFMTSLAPDEFIPYYHSSYDNYTDKYTWHNQYVYDYPIKPVLLSQCEVLVETLEYAGKEMYGKWVPFKEFAGSVNLQQNLLFRLPYDTMYLWMRVLNWQKTCLYDDDIVSKNNLKIANLNDTVSKVGFCRGRFRTASSRYKVLEHWKANIADVRSVVHGVKSLSQPIKFDLYMSVEAGTDKTFTSIR